jgi:hypothetical protein
MVESAQQKSLVMPNMWLILGHLLLVEAFCVAGSLNCHLLFYRLYLPLVGILFVYGVFWFLRTQTLGFLGVLTAEGQWEDWSHVAPGLIRRTLEDLSWTVLWIVVYFFVHVRANKSRFKHIFFVNKLPTVAIVLVGLSFLREFPEYSWLRDALKAPPAEVVQGVILVMDSSLVAIMCICAALGWGLRKDASA